MNSRLLFGIFGVLLLTLMACSSSRAPVSGTPATPQAPVTQATPAPAPAPAPEPVQPVAKAPASDVTPVKVVEQTTSGDGVTRDKELAPVTTGKAPVGTENKYTGQEGSFIASVDCGTKDGLSTFSVTVMNAAKGQVFIGDRPQVFNNGDEMIGLNLNGRYVVDYVECAAYDEKAGMAPGAKITCSATVPPNSMKEKVVVRHAENLVGNPMVNILNVYSPDLGREQVQFEC